MSDFNQWRSVMGASIIDLLERIDKKMFSIEDLDYSSRVSEYAPDLEEAEQIQDVELKAAYRFADMFFFFYREGDPDMEYDIPWNEAFALIRILAEQLKRGQKITDPRILRYADS